jgi:biopolymer transport protein ExbD
MVDLAFLLITFFMLTTSLSKPKAMEIALPDTETIIPDPPKIDDDVVSDGIACS